MSCTSYSKFFSYLFVVIFIFISATDSKGFANSKEKIDSLNAKTYKTRKTYDIAKMKSLLDSTQSYLAGISYPNGRAWYHLNQGIYYHYKKQYDSLLFNINRAEQYFISEDKYYELGIVNRYKGFAYRYLNNWEKCKEYQTKEYMYFEKINNIEEMAKNLGNQGITFGMQNEYPEALNLFLKALELKLSVGGEASSEYHNISIVYNRMGEYDKAKQFLNKAIDYNLSINDSLSLAGDYNSLGGIYNVSGELDSAIHFYKKGCNYNENSHNKGLQALLLNNIAEIYLEQEKMVKALNYIHLAINIRQEKGAAKHLSSLETLSKYYIKTQAWDSALYYAQKVYTGASRIGEKNYMRQSAYNISTIYRNQSKYDSALSYYEKYTQANDSIYNMEKSKLFTNLQIQLETQENEAEIKELIQQEEYNKIVIYTLGVIILLVLIATYLLYATLKTRHQKKQLQLTADKLLLEQKIEHNKNELFNLTLNMLNKNNCLLEVEEALKKATQNGGEALKPDKILKSIEINRSSDKDWENFNKYFGVVHEEFFNLLRAEYPDLSTNEIRLCTLLKLHLSNKEIAKILYIEPNSVKVASYRLKKKFGLEEDVKLVDFVEDL